MKTNETYGLKSDQHSDSDSDSNNHSNMNHKAALNSAAHKSFSPQSDNLNRDKNMVQPNPALPTLLGEYYQSKAQHHAITNIINCYCREFAIPNDEVSLNTVHQDLPLCLTYSQSSATEKLMTIHFPAIADAPNSKLVIPISYMSRVGKCKLAGSPWLKTNNQQWHSLNIYQLVTHIHDYVAQRYQIDVNNDLITQIKNSINVTTAFLQSANRDSYIDKCQQSNPDLKQSIYIDSEQAMLWGHAYHPSPKSRQGIDMPSLLAHSPETQSQFSLYWFKIHPALVTYIGKEAKTILNDIAETLLTSTELDANNDTDDSETLDWVYYPCHPWESEGILANADIKKAIQLGYVVPIGICGQAVSPTSSVRTLYQQHLTHFIKCSIHVRLTNCIRKNAWYELHSAVYLNNLLSSIYRTKRLTNPTFKLMLEPGATSVDIGNKIPNVSEASATFIQESFGLLFRKSFTNDELIHLTPQVAGALFTEDHSGKSVVAKYLKEEESSLYQDRACLWLTRYANILINGVFDYFFNHGVVFEPHLQNTVIGFTQGLPTCIWVRDLEGTKLIDSLWSLNSETALPERSKNSMMYSREKGWSRIAYCVFINNISEAIFYLCQGLQQASTLEQRLWMSVKEILINWQMVYGVQPEIQALLEDGTIPSKTNYKTRLLQLSDRESSYAKVPTPWQPSFLNIESVAQTTYGNDNGTETGTESNTEINTNSNATNTGTKTNNKSDTDYQSEPNNKSVNRSRIKAASNSSPVSKTH